MSIVCCNTSISPEYFKNEMDEYELYYILNEINKNEKNNWEKLRWGGYISLVPYLKEGTKPTDIHLFEWEKNDIKDDVIIDEEKMKNAIENYYKNINN